MTPTQTELAVALEELAKAVPRTQRPRNRIAAPVELTNAYAEYLFACGFASLGDRERCAAFVDDARTSLAPVADDPIHGFVIAMFETRAEQALAGTPHGAPFPDEHVRRYATVLDRLGRYKVDRLRAACRLLELGDADAVERHARAETLLAPAVMPRSAAQIEALLANPDDADDELLATCLDALCAFPEDPGIPLVFDTLPVIARRIARIELYARALAVVAHLHWVELVPHVYGALRDAVDAEASPALVAPAVSPSVRALRHAECTDELRDLLGKFDRVSDLPRAARLALAGADLSVGDPRGGEIFASELARLDGDLRMIDRLDAIRDVANGYAHADVASAVRGVSDLMRYFRNITDSYGTNTHFCLSALHFVDALVYALIGVDSSRPGWRLTG